MRFDYRVFIMWVGGFSFRFGGYIRQRNPSLVVLYYGNCSVVWGKGEHRAGSKNELT